MLNLKYAGSSIITMKYKICSFDVKGKRDISLFPQQSKAYSLFLI